MNVAQWSFDISNNAPHSSELPSSATQSIGVVVRRIAAHASKYRVQRIRVMSIIGRFFGWPRFWLYERWFSIWARSAKSATDFDCVRVCLYTISSTRQTRSYLLSSIVTLSNWKFDLVILRLAFIKWRRILSTVDQIFTPQQSHFSFGIQQVKTCFSIAANLGSDFSNNNSSYSTPENYFNCVEVICRLAFIQLTRILLCSDFVQLAISGKKE